MFGIPHYIRYSELVVGGCQRQLSLSHASKIAGIVSFNLMRSPDLVGWVEV